MESSDEEFELIDSLFCGICELVCARGEQFLSAEQKVVFHVWAALGALENGGFQYFFEQGLDPILVAEALENLNLCETAAVLRQVHRIATVDPKRSPSEVINDYFREEEPGLDPLAKLIVDQGETIQNRLAAFIKESLRDGD